jgi:ribosomal protein S28E/S33
VVEEVIALVFAVMDDYRTGQAGSVFQVRAEEMGHLVLSNRARQTTR